MFEILGDLNLLILREENILMKRFSVLMLIFMFAGVAYSSDLILFPGWVTI